jgi:SAM-dependent methyltransferase
MWRAPNAAHESARGYERSTPRHVRAERGLFYTPDDVADVVAKGALALWVSEGKTLAGKTILDPSCGAGALLAAVRRAAPAVPLRLVGGDIDSRAIALARARLGDEAELYVGDALTETHPRGDLVVTNPPYGRDPGSDDLDRYVTFWRAALARVAPGGVLAVLAPRSWRTGPRYARARREVMDRAGVRRVLELPSGAFPDAYVDTCVALCVPRPSRVSSSVAIEERAQTPATRTLGALFFSRRGILAPSGRGRGMRLLVGPVAPFVWPKSASAFTRVDPRGVVEGKGALRLGVGPRLLVRRIVGRASRLSPVVATSPALVKKDFYVFVPREPSLCLPAYAAFLHAGQVAAFFAETDETTTKGDFAQLTLTRLRALPVPRLVTGSRAATWLEGWAREAGTLGRRLAREQVREVDQDRRWAPLRERLDAFVEAPSSRAAPAERSFHGR